jgi:prophage regulatory protein
MQSSSDLPDGGYIRLHTIIGNRRTGTPGLLPIAASTWWAGVKSGRYPRPVKLGPRITAWRVQEILELAERLAR